MKTLTLARHEALKIGDDITRTARHDGGQVRIEIEVPSTTTLERVIAHDYAGKMPAERIRWVRTMGDKK